MRDNYVSHARVVTCAILAGVFFGVAPVYADAPVAEPLHFRVTGYRVDGLSHVDPQSYLQLLSRYTGDDIDLERVRAAAAALQEWLHARGYTLSRVIVPEQTLDGQVALSVIDPKLHTISVLPLGSIHTEEKVPLNPDAIRRVRRVLPALVEGAPLNIGALARNVTLANENPSRTLDVQLAPDAEPGAVAADIGVSERSPWALTTILNNSGTREPARSRLTMVVSDSRLFDTDQSLTLSGTTSPEASSNIRQYGLSYRLPIYTWGGAFSAYGFYSNSQSNPAGGFFTIQGQGRFYGVAYTHHFAPTERWRDSLTFALDDRWIADQSSFSGKTIGTPVRARPVSMTYAGRLTSGGDSLGITISLAHNLQSGSDNDNTAYQLVRAGANPEWDALRLHFDGSMPFAHGVASAKLSGQLSSTAMLPAEAFGLGGQDSIRALDQRQMVGDSGGEFELQWDTPTSIDSLTAHIFSDNGFVSRRGNQPGLPSNEHVAAYGAGLIWSAKFFSLSLDYGRVYSGGPDVPAGTHRVYAELRSSF